MNRPSLRLSVVALFAALLVTSWSTAAQADREPDDLTALRAALRATDYATAIQLADACVEARIESADEALYLRAIAQLNQGAHDGAVASVDRLISDHAGSPWRRKALFLKAHALSKQRRFEPAEAIYEAEAHRLLSSDRKEEIAQILIQFADELGREPDPDDVGAPPANHAKAYNLYRQAMEMEIGRDLRDELLYRISVTALRARMAPNAIQHLHEYLEQFDPDWLGPVGSSERMRGQKRENPPPAGTHVRDARFQLALAQLQTGQRHAARQNLRDLQRMLGDGDADRAADVAWQVVLTYGMPGVSPFELPLAIRSAERYLEDHPSHVRAVEAAWLIPLTYAQLGRVDDVVAAYERFIDNARHELPPGPAATATLPDRGASPAELQQMWRQTAHFEIGRIRFDQTKYEDAIDWWKKYVTTFPNGPQWSDAQRRIIDARFSIALDAVAAGDAEVAGRLLDAFLTANPLDGRAPQVLFIKGQLHASAAEELMEEAPPGLLGSDGRPGEHAAAALARSAYGRAIREWAKLISKYPGTEESSLALYRTAVIQEERLGSLEAALDSYRRLTWGSWAAHAQQRIAIMTRKHLDLRTERTYRTTETARIRVGTRNIERVTIRQYFLDPEAYFRKTHTTGGVEALDIALIEPDRTWEVAIDEYRKYQPLEQTIDVPIDGARPGVCIVNVAEDDLEATTLVIRSDLDMAVRASRREVLIYVQEMTTGRPAADVDLLLSDGRTVFATERTGTDGVFRRRFDELTSLDDLRVFAGRDGHIASNQLSLAGLQRSGGLTAKGYLYTDRPAYQPGQTVQARGVIRDVSEEGLYVAPADQVYVVSVIDPRGRLLHQEARALSEFGTFDASFELDGLAPVGHYRISAHPEGRSERTYVGGFEVQQFQLEKMRLALEFDRTVYFQGETVTVTLAADYYWGEPAAGQSISYQLPDGRTYTERTDDEGRLTVEFDTTGVMPGQTLRFAAQIDGENVQTAGVITLSTLGFHATVAPAQDLALAGEPFDVTVTTSAVDGTPVGKTMTLHVLRRVQPEPDPVLSRVPWAHQPPLAPTELTVQEHVVRTDAATGRGTIRLTIDDGGSYLLRAAGNDRFQQTVTAETTVSISGNLDEVKLRLLSEDDTLQVGSTARVRLHSRVQEGTALLTWEGETIIAHRIVEIGAGDNAVEFEVGHEHFPNFALGALVLDGRSLRTASKPFTVERQLEVTVRPVQDVYPPGRPGTVEITVTDQLGRPVVAELSLAMVDEALLALHPDRLTDIREFFQSDARRHAEFAVAATNGFSYEARTRGVVKAILEEQSRLVQAQTDTEEMAEMRDQLADLQLGVSLRRAQAGQAVQESEAGYPWQRGGGGARGDDAPVFAAKSSPATAALARDRAAADEAGAEPARRERLAAGWWSPSIVTGADGVARVPLTMPENTTTWRLIARGVTVETLAGQATAAVVTSADLFVEIKSPPAAVEGDRLAIIGRVHNMTDYEGPVDLTLTVTSGARRYAELKRRVEVKARRGAETVFEPFEVPAVGALDVTIGVTAGEHRDALTRRIAVRPWGMVYAAQGGGSGANSASLQLALPANRPYRSRWLTVNVGPSLEQAVIDMALGPHPIVAPEPRHDDKLAGVVRPRGDSWIGGTPASELLAAVSGLRYAERVGAAETERLELERRARSLISALTVSQHDQGGWGWAPGANPDWDVTCMAYWALQEARRSGLAVHAETLGSAKQFLQNAYQRAQAVDHDMKAILLHALSVGDAADFKLANSLYRERNQLGALALGYTALTLANLEREEIAKELVQLLESRAQRAEAGGRSLCSWTGGTRSYPWLSDDLHTTAVVLMAMMRVTPDSPRVAEAAQFLLHRRGCFGIPGGFGRATTVAALGGYFAHGQFADADYRLTVIVNGTPVRTIERRDGVDPVTLEIAETLLRDGVNRVEFEMEGRGRYTYAATLRGFSATFDDPQSWRYPYVYARRYFHAPLTYRGVPINATSTSPVTNIEIGQRVRVHVDLYNSSHDGFLVVEEPLPAGMTLVPGSLTGDFRHHEIRDGRIYMYTSRGEAVRDYSYELVGYASGAYRVPPTVIRDALDPSRMRVGQVETLNVLRPGERSDDPYRMNDSERFALGTSHFDDGDFEGALGYLWPLFDRDKKYQERAVARMLLWIHTTDELFDASRVVAAFELLTVRHPELTIPFDKILAVGRAYRYIGELERAAVVFRATIDSSFLTDSGVAAILQDEGQLLGSIDYQESLWWQYPDTADVASSYLALSQMLYENAGSARELTTQGRAVRLRLPGEPRAGDGPARPAPTRASMLAEAIRLLYGFMTLYPSSPLGDDAAFSLSNAFLDLKDYDAVVDLSRRFQARFDGSEFESSFQYMAALGHFWKRDYEPALDAARIVADGASRDRDFARYILGQIYHAQGDPRLAIDWYEKVKEQYPDAGEAIDYFQKQLVELDEVSIFRPGDEVELPIRYRNIASAHLQVYRVDLMKLYLREKSLSRITAINLAGIEPELVESIELGDGRDYVDKEHTAVLDVEEEGAYLVICRGDDLFASGLVLVTPLKIEVQEEAVSGRVRVNLVDELTGVRPAGVHVKAIGSGDQRFLSGETDLRGIFVADGLQGTVTAIARDAKSRYAFYRGERWIGQPAEQEIRNASQSRKLDTKAVDYQNNLRQQNEALQRSYNTSWDKARRSGEKGVQVQKAK